MSHFPEVVDQIKVVALPKYGSKAHKKIFIEQYRCDCNGKAVALTAGTEPICNRCIELQSAQLNQEIRDRATIKEALIKWDEPLVRNSQYSAIPDWLRRYTKDDRDGNFSDILLRIDSRIEDDGKTITVYGHGKYQLPIVDNAEVSDGGPMTPGFK